MNIRLCCSCILFPLLCLAEDVSLPAFDPSGLSVYESLLHELEKGAERDLRRGQVRLVISESLGKTVCLRVYHDADLNGDDKWGIRVSRYDRVTSHTDLRGDVAITESEYSYLTDARALKQFLKTYDDIGPEGRAKLVGLDGVGFFLEWKDSRENVHFVSFWSPAMLVEISEDEFRKSFDIAKPDLSEFLEYSQFLLQLVGIAIMNGGN